MVADSGSACFLRSWARSSELGAARGGTDGGITRSALGLTPSSRNRSYANRDSATVASAKSSFLTSTRSAGTLQTVWTLGTLRTAVASAAGGRASRVGCKKEMPKMGRATQEQMTQYPQVVSGAGRKATGGPGAVDRLDPSLVDRVRLTGAPHQNGAVAPEMTCDIADQVLAAVVPRGGDRLGYEEDFSHSQRCYAVLRFTASA